MGISPSGEDVVFLFSGSLSKSKLGTSNHAQPYQWHPEDGEAYHKDIFRIVQLVGYWSKLNEAEYSSAGNGPGLSCSMWM